MMESSYTEVRAVQVFRDSSFIEATGLQRCGRHLSPLRLHAPRIFNLHIAHMLGPLPHADNDTGLLLLDHGESLLLYATPTVVVNPVARSNE
jgi:hypothetical protein